MRFPGVLSLLCSLLLCPGVRAAVLSLESPPVAPGQIAIAALSFSSGGQSISGIQFDMEWDPSLDIKAAAGSQIGTSSKVLYTAVLSDHARRFLIVGLNDGQISDGELLKCFLSAAAGPALGTAQIRFTNVVASSPQGDPVPVQASPAAIPIQSATSSPALPPEAILNAASLAPGPVSPGEIITILGVPGQFAAPYVIVNGIQAPTLYSGSGQLNAIVPFGLSQTGTANFDLQNQGVSLGKVSVQTAAVTPAIFTLSGNGTGPGAILNQDFSVNSFDNPARADSVIMVYSTGFGTVNPPATDGLTATGPASTTALVTATIAGVPAQVTYAGTAPGLIAGVTQVNVQIPKGLAASSAAPIALSIRGVSTPPGATLAIQ
jgi:uncharacterized protein (TIGR03437 family)